MSLSENRLPDMLYAAAFAPSVAVVPRSRMISSATCVADSPTSTVSGSSPGSGSSSVSIWLPSQSVGNYTTVDLNVIYDLGKTFPGVWSKDLTLTAHVDNLFDKDPPYVNIPISPNGGGGFDPNVASAIGRLVSLQIAKKF